MSNLYFNNVEKVGQLYLEYVFFEFESEPILFICHDQLNQTYLCLCSDIRHGQKWIITKCDTKILRALITAEIDIVTAFLKHQKAIVIELLNISDNGKLVFDSSVNYLSHAVQ